MFYHFISKYTDIFAEKLREAFCIAKSSHTFSAKNIGVFQILTFEILTNDINNFEQLATDLHQHSIDIVINLTDFATLDALVSC